MLLFLEWNKPSSKHPFSVWDFKLVIQLRILGLLRPSQNEDDWECLQRLETLALNFIVFLAKINDLLLLVPCSFTCVDLAIQLNQSVRTTCFLSTWDYSFSLLLIPVRGQILLLSFKKIGFCLLCLRNPQHQADSTIPGAPIEGLQFGLLYRCKGSLLYCTSIKWKCCNSPICERLAKTV